MRLQLLTPPALVSVRDVDGARRPALLLGRRADRAYVQVSRGPGDNVLRWLPGAAVDEPAAAPAAERSLPARPDAAPVALRGPRAQR